MTVAIDWLKEHWKAGAGWTAELNAVIHRHHGNGVFDVRISALAAAIACEIHQLSDCI